MGAQGWSCQESNSKSFRGKVKSRHEFESGDCGVTKRGEVDLV